MLLQIVADGANFNQPANSLPFKNNTRQKREQ